jgi:hypothetical protein
MKFRAVLIFVAVMCAAWITWMTWAFGQWAAVPTGPFGLLRQSTVKGSAPYPILSPDGKLVAIVHEVSKHPGSYSELVTTKVEVRDTVSSAMVGAFSLPPVMTAANGEEWWSNFFAMQYCDRGQYLVLPSQDQIYVVDAKTLQVHTVFSLRAFGDASTERTAKTHSSYVVGSCSTNGKVAVFNLSEGRFWDAGVVRLVDLETGQELKGIENIDTAHAESVVVSPSGDRIAFLQNKRDPDGDLVLFHTRDSSVQRISVRNRGYADGEKIAFAGDSSIVMQEKLFTGSFVDGGKASFHLIDLNTNSDTELFGDKNFDEIAVSVDGRTIMGYRYRKSFFQTSRFILWNRETGKTIVESPALKSTYQSCFGPTFMGSCTPSYNIPSLQLSQDGHSVLAWWRGEPPKVFSLR